MRMAEPRSAAGKIAVNCSLNARRSFYPNSFCTNGLVSFRGRKDSGKLLFVDVNYNDTVGTGVLDCPKKVSTDKWFAESLKNRINKGFKCRERACSFRKKLAQTLTAGASPCPTILL